MTRTGFAINATTMVALIAASGYAVTYMGKNFLPAFDEGAVQVNLFARPGTSLKTSREMSRIADRQFRELLRTKES